MGKYIHWFKTEDEYNQLRNSEGYIEPWVSLTKYKTYEEGDVLKFVGDYTDYDGQTRELEFAYQGQDYDHYRFISGTQDMEITAVGMDGDSVTSITVNNLVMELDIEYEDGYCYWFCDDEHGIENGAITSTFDPKAGDTCLYYVFYEGSVTFFGLSTGETRNPEVGHTYEDSLNSSNSVLVKSITKRGEGKGELLNASFFNKGITFNAKVMDRETYEYVTASSLTRYNAMSYNEVYELYLLTLEGKTIKPFWDGVRVAVTNEADETLADTSFMWTDETIVLPIKERVRLISESVTKAELPVILNVDTGALNQYYNRLTINIYYNGIK